MLTDNQSFETIDYCHFHNGLNRCFVVKTTIAADDQGLIPGVPNGIKHRLYKVFQIMFLLEYLNSLTQT